MVSARNSVTLIGRITRDIEERRTNSDIPVCNFSIAVQRQGQTKDDKPDFFDCVAWRETAQRICKFFHKGDPIAVHGALQTSEYKDKDGNDRRKVEVQVDTFDFLPSRKQKEDQGEPVPVAVPPEEMPF